MYIEKDGEIIRFEYDGQEIDLSEYDAEKFLSGVEGGYLKFKDAVTMGQECLHTDAPPHTIIDELSNPAANPTPSGSEDDVENLPSADTNGHNDIGDATSAAIKHLTVEVAPQNEVHRVDIPIEVKPASDGWMDEYGNDPEDIDLGMADIPILLSDEQRKAAMEERPQADASNAAMNPVSAKPPKELAEDEIREVSMTAAAREAARLHGIEYIHLQDTPSYVIVRANAAVPGFLADYGECLGKVGLARTLDEIAEAFPAQRDWIFR